MSVLELIPNHWWSWDFHVIDGGSPVAKIDVSWWREKGVLEVDGVPYNVYREGWVSGAFIMESVGERVAQANKPSVLTRSFVVTHEHKTYGIKAASLFTRRFIVFKDDQQIGFISPKGPFTRKSRVELPDELPLAVRVFMIWLTAILWKRESGYAAASVATVNR